MLTDVSQEIQHIDISRPVEIVHHQRRVIAIKINKLADLLTYFIDPATDNLRGVELALGRFEAGVSDQTSRPTHQRNGAVTRRLKATQHQQWYE